MSLLTGSAKIIEARPDPVGAALLDQHLEKSISLGQIVPARDDGKPVFSDWSTEQATREGLKASVWVYRCVSILARAVASAPLRLVDPETREVNEQSALNELLKMPNDFWTGQNLLERVMYDLLLGGNAIISKNRGGLPAPAPVLELWLLPPDRVKPIKSRENFIAGYEFKTRQGDKRFLPAEDIIHLWFVDPSNPWWGLSPLQAAGKTVDTEVEAQTWNKVSLKNRAVADGMITFGRRLSRKQYVEARLRIREQHMGSQNARVPWVMGEDARWTPMQMSPVEMDFLGGRKMNREEICATFGVPPVSAGDLERATYANYETARLVLWRDTIVPILDMLDDALTMGLVPDFGEQPDVLRFDLSKIEILNRLTPEMIQTAQGLQAMGVPFEEVNRRLNLGIREFEGWGVSYLGSGLTPAAQLEADIFGSTTFGQLSDHPPDRKNGIIDVHVNSPPDPLKLLLDYANTQSKD